MLRRAIATACLLTLLVGPRLAPAEHHPQPGTADEPRVAYEKELAQLRVNSPAEFEKRKRLQVITTQVVLAQLGYGVGPFDGLLDERTTNALRAYQRNRKVKVTGDPLAFETLEQIMHDGAVIDDHPVGLPPLHVLLDLWDTGHVSAKGTWTFTSEEMAQPQRTSDIECHRDQGICTEATAIVHGEGTKRLTIHTDIYHIERWDKHEILTKPKQFGCVRQVRRFNRVQKSVTGLRNTTSQDDACKAVDAKEFHMQLSNGFDVYWKLLQRFQKQYRSLMQFTPDAMKLLDQQPASKR